MGMLTVQHQWDAYRKRNMIAMELMDHLLRDTSDRYQIPIL